MAKLGLNVVRVYEVDPKKDHDACMKSFADNGLYLLLDIATPKFSINRKQPQYTLFLYNAYKAVVDAFGKYDNVLAFIAGNEVTNDKTNTQASPFVKAAIRDIKHYVRTTQKRYIPVGYASNDDEHIRDAMKDYFNCGEEDAQADFFGVNLYEWCGGSTFQKSGYADRTAEFAGYSKPVFLSEYGCNLVLPRQFGEVSAIYGPEMNNVWSGGVVYEWTQEKNNYGLVKIDSKGNAEVLEDYTHLQRALQQVNLPQRKMSEAEKRPTPGCPAQSDTWRASTILPPTPSEGACDCMRNNLACVASNKVTNTNGANNTSALGAQIDMLCGMVSCMDISADGENGRYGAYSFCAPSDKLSWLYHLYTQGNKQRNSCDFDGYAQPVAPRRNDLSECAKIVPNLEGSGNQGLSNAATMVLVPDMQMMTFSLCTWMLYVFANLFL
ncbi:1,3-beta-glucanosyltransferase gas1 [Apophysomyces ossiformis]|uniref:1,3-beta-glucanosyltransferase n=1 Tax=Apophysomyces ossiformis TaxID=679940 RepID=A0A8H7BVP7_9FUNG|nr:1,3-beta-glucanosyltransferase gas1 [Apophysomyces ossiformis]